MKRRYAWAIGGLALGWIAVGAGPAAADPVSGPAAESVSATLEWPDFLPLLPEDADHAGTGWSPDYPLNEN
ncbi:hypothetical protein [Streptomyces sp. NPDC058486]|uniref:hypothetical protein n=1 Tax=unclassified Streptomyces TaxID=2593676 RepID=UPI00364BAA19